MEMLFSRRFILADPCSLEDGGFMRLNYNPGFVMHSTMLCINTQTGGSLTLYLPEWFCRIHFFKQGHKVIVKRKL